MSSPNPTDLSAQKIKNEIEVFKGWFEERSGSFSKWSKVVALTLSILSALITIYVFVGLQFGYLGSILVLTVVLCVLYIPFMLRRYMALSMIKFMGLSITTFQQVIDKVEVDIKESRRDIDSTASEFAAIAKEMMDNNKDSTQKTDGMIKRLEERLNSTYALNEAAFLEKIEGIIVRDNKNYKDKYDQMRDKFKDVAFKAVNSVNEFTPAEAKAVKLGLIRGVQDSVHTIHLVEKYLPLPMVAQDDINYFEENKKAYGRIQANHPNVYDREENNIHRVFVISAEFLTDDADKVSAIKAKIDEHEKAPFDVKIALKEELTEPPTFEFAIYDNQIVLRLSIDHIKKDYGDGIVYFDDAVLRDVYGRRYKDIEAESCKPVEFWEKPEVKNLIRSSERNQ